MRIQIISGGQPGVEQGALYGAKECKKLLFPKHNYNYNYKNVVETLGYAAKGWDTEKGSRKELLGSLGLIEDASQSMGKCKWKSRDKRNIIMSDIVIAIRADNSKRRQNPDWIYLVNNSKYWTRKACHYAYDGKYKNEEVIRDGDRFQYFSGLRDVIIIWNMEHDIIKECVENIVKLMSKYKDSDIISITFIGVRESEQPGIQDMTMDFVYRLLKKYYKRRVVEYL